MDPVEMLTFCYSSLTFPGELPRAVSRASRSRELKSFKLIGFTSSNLTPPSLTCLSLVRGEHAYNEDALCRRYIHSIFSSYDHFVSSSWK